MISQISFVTIIVRDQEEALNWYTSKLGLEKRLDIPAGKMRWLSVGVPGQKAPEIILQEPSLEEYGQEMYGRKVAQIGNGTTWVLGTNDCRKTIDEFRSRGVEIVEDPEDTPWGVSALIKDLYGNFFSVVQRK